MRVNDVAVALVDRGSFSRCEALTKHADGMDQAAFVADGLTYDASLRNLELVGEAATHVPSAVRERNPEISWRTIIGARNRLTHGYLSVDDDLIWDIIQNDVPKLLPALRDLLDTTSKDPI